MNSIASAHLHGIGKREARDARVDAAVAPERGKHGSSSDEKTVGHVHVEAEQPVRHHRCPVEHMVLIGPARLLCNEAVLGAERVDRRPAYRRLQYTSDPFVDGIRM